MKVMTRGLGMFSRVEQTQRTLVDLQSAIESAIAFATSEMVSRARLVKAFSELPAVWGSEGKLSQVFLNLLVNAAHAIKEGNAQNNQITVRSWVADTMVNVEITDTGAGIPAKDLERIFEPFFTTKAPGQGLGLGLDNAMRIVRKHRGHISVRSEPGSTCFRVRLPLDQLQAY
jgi:signal transduction histidine kinase